MFVAFVAFDKIIRLVIFKLIINVSIYLILNILLNK